MGSEFFASVLKLNCGSMYDTARDLTVTAKREDFLLDAPFGLPAAFHITTPEALTAHLEGLLGAKCIKVAPVIQATAGVYRLPCGELWSSQYSAPLSVRVDDDILRVHFGGDGPGWAQIGADTIELTAQRAAITLGPLTRHIGEGTRQISWRIDPKAVSAKLAALSGIAAPASISFHPCLDLNSGASRTFERTLHCLLKAIPDCSSPAASLVLAELEQALIVSLLSISRHTFSQLLERPSLHSASEQVRRVEDYLAVHWNEPLDIERIARLAGTSTRSLYRTFRRQRGYSPMEFLRQRRLQHARELLEHSAGMATITEIAFACGFCDTSHFSREYSRAFGEPPSATLRRACKTDCGPCRVVPGI